MDKNNTQSPEEQYPKTYFDTFTKMEDMSPKWNFLLKIHGQDLDRTRCLNMFRTQNTNSIGHWFQKCDWLFKIKFVSLYYKLILLFNI